MSKFNFALSIEQFSLVVIAWRTTRVLGRSFQGKCAKNTRVGGENGKGPKWKRPEVIYLDSIPSGFFIFLFRRIQELLSLKEQLDVKLVEKDKEIESLKLNIVKVGSWRTKREWQNFTLFFLQVTEEKGVEPDYLHSALRSVIGDLFEETTETTATSSLQEFRCLKLIGNFIESCTSFKLYSGIHLGKCRQREPIGDSLSRQSHLCKELSVKSSNSLR